MISQWTVATVSVMIFAAAAAGYFIGKAEQSSIEAGECEPTENRIGEVL